MECILSTNLYHTKTQSNDNVYCAIHHISSKRKKVYSFQLLVAIKQVYRTDIHASAY